MDFSSPMGLVLMSGRGVSSNRNMSSCGMLAATGRQQQEKQQLSSCGWSSRTEAWAAATWASGP